jgi:NAD(P)-dependent dehydrogenase (short-subunit alcohol dehydrogenase family)
VNNAGIFPPGTVLDTSADTFDNVLSVNVRAPFLLCQRAISYMLKSGGSIVNIGSTHAETGSPGIAAYAVSKGALRTLTRHIALNYAAAGIRANWITVGWVLTEGDYAAQRGRGLDDAQIRANAAGRIPSGRYQEGSEIADAAVFLLSDRASSHTDTDMRVTGGFTPGFGLPAGINVPEKILNF